MRNYLSKGVRWNGGMGSLAPQPLMGRINRISRCFTLYRNNQLEQEGLNGYQHLYICGFAESRESPRSSW